LHGGVADVRVHSLFVVGVRRWSSMLAFAFGPTVPVVSGFTVTSRWVVFVRPPLLLPLVRI
jgi:hypothetical protein